MVRYNRAFFNVVIVRILDAIDAQIVEDTNADDVEEKYAARFCDIRNFDRIETEYDGFASSEDASKDSDVVSKFLRGIGERTDPVVNDVVPELRENPV